MSSLTAAAIEAPGHDGRGDRLRGGITRMGPRNRRSTVWAVDPKKSFPAPRLAFVPMTMTSE